MTDSNPAHWSNSLRVRLLRMFAFTTALLMLLTLWITRDATYAHSTAQLMSHQQAASRVVLDRLALRSSLMRDALGDLADNFSLKELIASGADDPQSLAAAMENYQRRLDADFYAVLDADQAITVRSGTGDIAGMDPEACAEEGLTWVDVDGRRLLVKAAPVRFTSRSRNVNAWILLGQQVAGIINQELVELTGMQMSLATMTPAPAIWGSTLTEDLAASLARTVVGTEGVLQNLQLGSVEYVVGVNVLPGSEDLYAVSALPTDEAFLNYQSLLLKLIILLLVAAAVTSLAALTAASSVIKPIQQLVGATRLIREGLEAVEFPTKSTNEVNALSTAISEMQQGIREREGEINRLAFYDELTGLPNRVSFVAHIRQQIERLPEDGQVTVALIDVDRFGEFNDTVGHDMGDALLVQISDRLRRTRRGDDFLARLGGDEFAVVTVGQAAHSQRLAEQIAEEFEQSFTIDALTLEVSVSQGLCSAPQHAPDAQSLMQRADIALNTSKASHLGFCVYDESLNRYSVRRLKLMTELKEALIDGQLDLHYQPKMLLDGDVVDCVECLVRWEHPEYGRVPPDDFIGLAEQTGSIRDLTHWALETALSQQKRWADQGHELAMAVNISAVDLIDMSLPAIVGELLSRFDASASGLTLEVTESAVMQDPESAILALKTLSRMGIKLSIDDFGTGFSSMAQLKKMPVDELKIDKAFVQELATNRDDQVMVGTFLSLAENLGLSTVAEGVEDADAQERLRDAGCTRIQGYYLSRPLRGPEFEAWLQDRIVAQSA